MNWTDASTKGWCKGGGLQGNPYIIENVTINGQGMRSCINITDSSPLTYFKINNCTLYNSSSGGNFAGIYLKNVNNGILSGNNISFCESGIYLDRGSDNINISGNFIYNVSKNGIFLDYLGANNVTDNTIFNSSGNGIGLFNCMNTIVENNIIHDIDENGIELTGDSSHHDNIIKSNKIYNNSESGIFLNGSSYSIDIINNEIKNNGHYGIFINKSTSGNVEGNFIDHNGYSGTYQKAGIYLNMGVTATFTKNTICNNKLYGMQVSFSVTNNIFNNTFINNPIHARDDYGSNQHWNSENLGNYWDDYWGEDFNDDGIGDIVYYLIGNIDRFPIWWDAPIISNIKPVQGAEYSTNAPEYQIQVDKGRGNFFWYEIIGSGTNRSYTQLYGAIREKTSGTINQTLWNDLPQGKVNIRFYINDSRGYIGYVDVEVTKYIPTPLVAIIVGDDDDGDGNEEEEDPYLWFIRAALAGAISACVGIVIKQSYSTVKKNRQLYELISKKLDEIEKLEQFFKANLGKIDWANFQPVYKDYTKRKISQKELIKEGKKSLGKRFIELFAPKSKRKFARKSNKI